MKDIEQDKPEQIQVIYTGSVKIKTTTPDVKIIEKKG